jgi:hypothetical protein
MQGVIARFDFHGIDGMQPATEGEYCKVADVAEMLADAANREEQARKDYGHALEVNTELCADVVRLGNEIQALKVESV